MEELGCELEITKIMYKDKFTTDRNKKWEVTIFLGKIKGEPKIQSSDTNNDIKWFEKEDLINVDLASYTKKDFERFGWI